MEDLIEKWLIAQSEFKKAKEKELALRKQICSQLFDGKVGEFKIKDETDIFEIEAESKINRTIDKTLLITLMDELSDEERDVIRYKPELNIAKYRKLPDDSILLEAITEKPSPTPVLKVKFKIYGGDYY